MKKKIFLSLLLIVAMLTITGCEKSNGSKSSNSKEYTVDGISFKLDKDDSRSGMKYKISKSFDGRSGSSTSTYYLYYDDTKDKYDISNIALSISVTADIMQTESAIENNIAKLNINSSLKNITRDKKTINDITWDYVTLDNYYETGKDDHFKNHTYYYEKYDGKYYTTYTVSFNKADNIGELESDFLNNITFEK